jgi:hypothetical protein
MRSWTSARHCKRINPGLQKNCRKTRRGGSLDQESRKESGQIDEISMWWRRVNWRQRMERRHHLDDARHRGHRRQVRADLDARLNRCAVGLRRLFVAAAALHHSGCLAAIVLLRRADRMNNASERRYRHHPEDGKDQRDRRQLGSCGFHGTRRRAGTMPANQTGKDASFCGNWWGCDGWVGIIRSNCRISRTGKPPTTRD